MSFDKKFGDWTLSEKASYVTGDAPTNAIFHGPNPQTMAAFINDTIAAANSNDAVLAAAAGIPATSAEATFVNGSGFVEPDRQVIQGEFWYVNKRIKGFVNDFRASREITRNNALELSAIRNSRRTRAAN